MTGDSVLIWQGISRLRVSESQRFLVQVCAGFTAVPYAATRPTGHGKLVTRVYVNPSHVVILGP